MFAKKNRRFTLYILALLLTIVYLFVTAPPPLMEQQAVQGATIPIQTAIEILNQENTAVRKLYTRDIVAAGKKAGLLFDEHWQDDGIFAGPLPAQFLREVALGLEQSRVRLGLYLGSDYAINKANQISGRQLEIFKQIRYERAPRFFFSQDTQVYVYMFPDVATVKVCVDCHNGHPDTPKSDWQLNDIMGATTWIYAKKAVNTEEFMQLLTALRFSIQRAYQRALDKLSQMHHPPVIGERWPAQGNYLPSVEEFMNKVNVINSSSTVDALMRFVQEQKQTQDGVNNHV